MTHRHRLAMVLLLLIPAWGVLRPELQAQDSRGLATAGAPEPLIVRAVELWGGRLSARKKKELMTRLHTQVGQPYSDEALEEDIRLIFYCGPASFGGRTFAELVPGGIKVVFAVP